MAEEVDEIVARKASTIRIGARSATGTGAARSGWEDGFGCGARAPGRLTNASEVPLATYEHFASHDPLAMMVTERMLARVSCRRYARTASRSARSSTQEASTSRSSISHTIAERSRTALGELMGRGLDDVRLAVLMLDCCDEFAEGLLDALGQRMTSHLIRGRDLGWV